jgi:hypothetical protein
MANRSQERSKEEQTTPRTKDEYRKNKMKRWHDTYKNEMYLKGSMNQFNNNKTSATSLIRSYLSDRIQCVWTNNQGSRFLPISCIGSCPRVCAWTASFSFVHQRHNSGNPDMQLLSICRRRANLHQLPSFRVRGLYRENKRRPWLTQLNHKLFW